MSTTQTTPRTVSGTTNVLVRALDGSTRCVVVDFARRDQHTNYPTHPDNWDTTSDSDAAEEFLTRVVRSGSSVALCPASCVVRFLNPKVRRWFEETAAAAGGLARVVTDVDAYVTPRTGGLLGGKGGFGTLLRTAARKGTQTTNFDACRDLRGRRLRAVNGEKKIAAWEAEAEAREAEKRAEKYLKEGDGGEASGSRAKLKEVEERAREAYTVESAAVSESVHDAVSRGLREAAVIEAAKKRNKRWGKEAVSGDSDIDSDDDDDEDIEDDALLFLPAVKRQKLSSLASASAPTPAPAPAREDTTTAAETSSKDEDDRPAVVDLSEYPSAAALEALGMDCLKYELMQRRLKCGGTLQERAARLFLLRDKTRDEIDKKHLAK